MTKPEVLFEYGIPMTKRKFFDLVVGASVGYELAFPGYKLGDVPMAGFLSGPLVGLTLGVRP